MQSAACNLHPRPPVLCAVLGPTCALAVHDPCQSWGQHVLHLACGAGLPMCMLQAVQGAGTQHVLYAASYQPSPMGLVRGVSLATRGPDPAMGHMFDTPGLG